MNRPDAVEIELPLRHVRLAAKAWGDPSDPPLLALHGWLDNAGSFDALAPLLTGRHVVALALVLGERLIRPATGSPAVPHSVELVEGSPVKGTA